MLDFFRDVCNQQLPSTVEVMFTWPNLSQIIAPTEGGSQQALNTKIPHEPYLSTNIP